MKKRRLRMSKQQWTSSPFCFRRRTVEHGCDIGETDLSGVGDGKAGPWWSWREVKPCHRRATPSQAAALTPAAFCRRRRLFATYAGRDEWRG
nr:hypothetical protein Itr_chr13CG15220 [Ipomoea trifida]